MQDICYSIKIFGKRKHFKNQIELNLNALRSMLREDIHELCNWIWERPYIMGWVIKRNQKIFFWKVLERKNNSCVHNVMFSTKRSSPPPSLCKSLRREANASIHIFRCCLRSWTLTSESDSESDSDGDSGDEGDRDDESEKLSAKTLLPLNTPSCVTKETLQSNHKGKTGLTPLKDPVVALNPLLVETLNILKTKTKSTTVDGIAPKTGITPFC